MTVLSNIKVLEDRFEVNALVFNSSSVLLQEFFHTIPLLWICSKIFPPSKKSIVLSDCSNSYGWIFVNSSCGECLIDIGVESSVIEESLWVISLIFIAEVFKFIVCQIEIHAWENGFELIPGDSALSQFVKVKEELFNSDSSHHNSGSKPIFNVFWVIWNIHTLLLEAISNDIKVVCGSLEVSAHLCWGNSEANSFLFLSFLCLVGGEHVFWAIYIFDEFIVIDLIVVSAVTVLPDD